MIPAPQEVPPFPKLVLIDPQAGKKLENEHTSTVQVLCMPSYKAGMALEAAGGKKQADELVSQ